MAAQSPTCRNSGGGGTGGLKELKVWGGGVTGLSLFVETTGGAVQAVAGCELLMESLNL